MYLMYGDEADAEEGRGQKFFLYAVFSSIIRRSGRHTNKSSSFAKVRTSPRGTALNPGKTRPANVTADAHRDIKKAVIALAEELEVTFSAYVILHAIGRAQQKI